MLVAGRQPSEVRSWVLTSFSLAIQYVTVIGSDNYRQACTRHRSWLVSGRAEYRALDCHLGIGVDPMKWHVRSVWMQAAWWRGCIDYWLLRIVKREKRDYWLSIVHIVNFLGRFVWQWGRRSMGNQTLLVKNWHRRFVFINLISSAFIHSELTMSERTNQNACMEDQDNNRKEALHTAKAQLWRSFPVRYTPGSRVCVNSILTVSSLSNQERIN